MPFFAGARLKGCSWKDADSDVLSCLSSAPTGHLLTSQREELRRATLAGSPAVCADIGGTVELGPEAHSLDSNQHHMGSGPPHSRQYPCRHACGSALSRHLVHAGSDSEDGAGNALPPVAVASALTGWSAPHYHGTWRLRNPEVAFGHN